MLGLRKTVRPAPDKSLLREVQAANIELAARLNVIEKKRQVYTTRAKGV